MNTKNLIAVLFILPFTLNVFAQRTEKRTLNDFTKIDVWGNIKIEFQKSDTNTVTLNVGDIPTDEIVTEVSNGTLKIKMRSNLFKETEINLKITYKEISEIKANASAELKFMDQIIGENLKIESIGGARVVLNVDLKNSDLTAYQGGQIDIKGKSDFSNIFANSGGMLSGTNLITQEANIKLNTGGTAEITVVKKLIARVNTKSSLSYFGKPEVEQIKASLGATVSKWDE